MTKASDGSKVVVLGASTKEERYSNRAVAMLTEYGFKPLPVHPSGNAVHGLTTVKTLGDITEEIDTLSMYIGAAISSQAYESIKTLKPRRIIFNPGSENEELAKKLAADGIEIVEACTLVMLRTGMF